MRKVISKKVSFKGRQKFFTRKIVKIIFGTLAIRDIRLFRIFLVFLNWDKFQAFVSVQIIFHNQSSDSFSGLAKLNTSKITNISNKVKVLQTTTQSCISCIFLLDLVFSYHSYVLSTFYTCRYQWIGVTISSAGPEQLSSFWKRLKQKQFIFNRKIVFERENIYQNVKRGDKNIRSFWCPQLHQASSPPKQKTQPEILQ